MTFSIHTAEHFQSLLDAAGFQSPQQPAAPDDARPQIPAADPQMQKQIEEDIKKEFAGNRVHDYLFGSRVHPATGRQGEELHKALDDIYAKLPEAIPEAKKLPPMPELYSLSQEDSRMEIRKVPGQPGLKADAILATKDVLKALSPDEKETLLAHEIGHGLRQVNSDTDAPLPPYVPPNMDSVRKELAKLNIPEDPNDARYQNYMEELEADSIAVRITRKPEALISGHAKLDKIYDKAVHDLVQQEIGKEEYREGRTLSAEEKKTAQINICAYIERMNNTDDPHPSNEVLAENARLTERELEKQDRERAKATGKDKDHSQGVEQHDIPTQALGTPIPGQTQPGPKISSRTH